MSNFWNEDQEEDKYMSEEEAEQILTNPNSNIQTKEYELEDQDEEQDAIDAFQQEIADEQSTQDLASKAMLQLEKGKLFKMLLDHNLFEGVDADPEAIKWAEKEVKAYVSERLEVLLGLKRDPKKQEIKYQVESPFTEVEIDLLKKFVSKMSNGATQQIKEVPKTNTIKSMAQTPQAPKPLKSSLSTSAPKKAVSEGKKKVATPLQTSQKIITKSKAVAKTTIESKPLDKPIHLMTAAEVAQRNKEISARNAANKAVPEGYQPPVYDANQLEMMYMQRNARSGYDGLAQTIMRLTKKHN